MKKSTSLKNILTIYFIIVAVLPVFAIGLIALHSLSNSMEKEIATRNFLLAKSISSELERFLAEPLTLLKQIKDVVEKKKIIGDPDVNTYLSSIVTHHQLFNMIKILNTDGVVWYLAPYNENISGIDMSNQKYYKDSLMTESPYWSQVFISPQVGQPTLTLTLPMEQGVIVGHLDLSDLSKIINKVRIGKNGYAVVVDRDGTIIAHRNSEFVAERLNVKSLPPVSQAIKGNEGTFNYNFRGQDKLASMAIVLQTRWFVGIVQPIDEAFAPVYIIRNIILSGCLAAIVLAIIISLVSLRKTLRPLLILTEESKRIAGGDYQYEIQETAYSEITNLGHSYKVMIDAVKTREEELKQHRDHLEEMVKERTSELEESKIAAEAANLAKSQFLANMSHEIRTPMNAILGFAEIMINKIENPQLTHYLESIYSSGKALLSLINDILDLSRVEAGKLRLEYNAMPMDKFFDEIETLFMVQIKDKNLEFIKEIQSDLPDALLIDEVRLRQILVNLIGNAIKFTESGHIKLSVGYFNQNHSNHSILDLIIRVEDTGIGIPTDQKDSIFDAFSQLTHQKFIHFSGTGLGLTITRNLAEIMGGHISVESKVGMGSVFTVIIKDIEITPIDALQEQLYQSVDLNSIQFAKSTILLADDIDYNRDVLKGFLEDYNFDFHEAENGKEVIELTRKYRPQLILLDMKMPLMDGYEASKIIKNDSEIKEIPIIAITASALKNDEEVIMKICNAYMRKPINKHDLIIKIMDFLPYAIKEDNVTGEIDGAQQLLSHETLKGYPELLEILKNEVTHGEELSAQMNINKIEEFAMAMNELGSRYSCKTLIKWSDLLNSAAEVFDIEKINQILREFLEIKNL